MSEEIKKLGICPICQKGQIVKGSIGYSCNYFKSMDDKCTFNIYTTYFNKQITEEIAVELITTGETKVFDDLQKKDGTLFSAYLKIENGIVIPVFANETLENPCPACGGTVEILLNGYACENYKQKEEEEEKRCALYIPNKIASRDIPRQAVEVLLQGKETPFMTGFKTKEGNEFSSRLILTKDLSVSFNSNLCKCPKCGGNLYSGKKAYNCSNYKNESIKCDFVIWKEISGRAITEDEAIQLCESKETPILSGFKTKEGGAMERKLIINEDFKVKLV